MPTFEWAQQAVLPTVYSTTVEPSVPPPSRRFSPRHLISAGILLLLLSGGGVMIWQRHKAQELLDAKVYFEEGQAFDKLHEPPRSTEQAIQKLQKAISLARSIARGRPFTARDHLSLRVTG